MARRRRRTRNAPARRRPRRHHAPRRRRNQPAMPVIVNVRRRQRNMPRRRARVGILPGLPPVAQMLPPVGAGIGGGLLVGWGTPMVAPMLGLAPAGWMYRILQAGIAWVGAWVLASFRMVDRSTAVAFATGGSVVAGLGLMGDWQRGLLVMAPGAAPVVPAVEGLAQEDEYDAMMGYYEPYGVGPTMGYYEAVA